MTNREDSCNYQENHTTISAITIKVEEDSEGGTMDADKFNEQLNVNDNSSGITIKEENIVECDIENIDIVQEVHTSELNIDKTITEMLRPKNGNGKCVLIPLLTRVDGLYNNQAKFSILPVNATETISRTIYSCNFCEKVLFHKRSLRRHLAAGVCVPRPAVSRCFLCDLCGETFKRRFKLTVHLNRHAGIYQFPCNHCGKRFVSARSLKYHEKSHSEMSFYCEICDKFFKSKSSFNRHTRAGHFRVLNHHCHVCDKYFTRKGELKKHLKRHLGLLHKCSTCRKEFDTEVKLETHRAMHTGEKPYLCEVCGSGFSCSYQLKSHITVHTGEKPFNCAECGKSFRTKCHLINHMITHTGERLFQCDICDKAFAKKYVMTLHRGIHFNSRPYKCSLCKYCFTQSTSLKRHMQTVHRIFS